MSPTTSPPRLSTSPLQQVARNYTAKVPDRGICCPRPLSCHPPDSCSDIHSRHSLRSGAEGDQRAAGNLDRPALALPAFRIHTEATRHCGRGCSRAHFASSCRTENYSHPRRFLAAQVRANHPKPVGASPYSNKTFVSVTTVDVEPRETPNWHCCLISVRTDEAPPCSPPRTSDAARCRAIAQNRQNPRHTRMKPFSWWPMWIQNPERHTSGSPGSPWFRPTRPRPAYYHHAAVRPRHDAASQPQHIQERAPPPSIAPRAAMMGSQQHASSAVRLWRPQRSGGWRAGAATAGRQYTRAKKPATSGG